MKIVPLLVSSIALSAGGLALYEWGLFPPAWLAGLECLLLSSAALLYGFTAWRPRLPDWVQLRPVRGAALVTFGIVALYVPPQLVVSAYLIGLGVRLVWQTACQLAAPDRTASPILRPANGRGLTGDGDHDPTPIARSSVRGMVLMPAPGVRSKTKGGEQPS